MCRDERFAYSFHVERRREVATEARTLSDIQEAISVPKAFGLRSIADAARLSGIRVVTTILGPGWRKRMWGRLNSA
jgi:hypothetical protein